MSASNMSTPNDEEANIPSVQLKEEEVAQSSPASDCNAEENEPFSERFRKGAIAFVQINNFAIIVLLAILIAWAYPPLGAEYLKPELTATWLAVDLIFFLVGIGLDTGDLARSIMKVRYNAFVQVYDILFISVVVYGVSSALYALNLVNRALADGMVVCACLPMSINAVIIMSANAHGDEGTAVFNSVFGNMLGVFLSPVLILFYLNDKGEVDLGEVFLKLTLKVIVPFIIGQIIQKTLHFVYVFYKKHKYFFKKTQELCLAFIVYTVFCRTFAKGDKSEIGHIFVVIVTQLILMVLLMIFAWFLLKRIFPNQPTLHATGLFGCTQKTISLGVPLIASMYGGSANEALYTLPILIWHPMQLVVGSIAAPKVAKYVDAELERLKSNDDEPQETKQDADNSSGEENAAAEAVETAEP